MFTATPCLASHDFVELNFASFQAQEIQSVVDSLTAKYCNSLYTQLVQSNLTPAMYATQWFLTMFTQRFPYDLVTRVWDIFLLEDFKIIYRVCLALFK